MPVFAFDATGVSASYILSVNDAMQHSVLIVRNLKRGLAIYVADICPLTADH
jgi:hypothetical protein